MITELLCSVLAASCGDTASMATPTTEIVQAVYEREASSGSSLHERDLKITTVDCARNTDGREYMCWVTFTSNTDASQTLHFDVASIEYVDGLWKLKNGLCRR